MSSCRRARAADQLRVARIAAATRSAVEPLEPGERKGHPLERERRRSGRRSRRRRRDRGRLDLGRRRRPPRASPAGTDARAAGSRRSPSRAPGRARASPRACPSSCARAASARAALELVLVAGAFASRLRTARAARAARGARRTRSRSRARRGPAAPGRPAAPGSAWPSCGAGDELGSPRRLHDLPSCTATAWARWRASTTSPRTTSTTIGSWRGSLGRLRMVGISRMFRELSTVLGIIDYDADDVLVVRTRSSCVRSRTRFDEDRLPPARAGGEHHRARRALGSQGDGRAPREGAREGRAHPRRPDAQVRALTEKYYGRVARLFVLEATSRPRGARPARSAAMMLRQAADEALASRPRRTQSALLHAACREGRPPLPAPAQPPRRRLPASGGSDGRHARAVDSRSSAPTGACRRDDA